MTLSRLSRRLLALVVCAMATSFAVAVKIQLPAAGDWRIEIGGGTTGSSPKFIDSKEATADLGEVAAGSEVWIYDLKSGNAAHFAGSAVKEGLKIATADFSYVRFLTVQLVYQGKSVQSGEVSIGDQTAYVAPAADGTVKFGPVKGGSVKVMVRHLPILHAGDADQLTQVFEVPLVRDRIEPKLTIAVASAVSVNEPPEAAKKPDEGKKEATPEKAAPAAGKPIDNLVRLTIGLVALAGAAYLILKYLPQNKDLINQQAAKLGLQIPDESGAADPSPTPPAVTPAVQPVEKILLPDAEPTILGGAPVVPAPIAAQVVAAGPRFLMADGSTRVLEEGSHVVSREAGSPLSFEGNSTISRHHAEVVRTGAEVVVRDMGSTNGTWVNGVRIESDTHLKSGDTVQFGSATMRFES